MKNQLVNMELNSFKNLIIKVLLILIISACHTVYYQVSNLSEDIGNNTRVVVKFKGQVDMQQGIIIYDSLKQINSLVNFLEVNDDFSVRKVVNYSNQLIRHAESANLLGFNIYKSIESLGIHKSRIAYTINYDEKSKIPFYSKNQDIKFYLKD